MADDGKKEAKKEVQCTRFDITIPYYEKDSDEPKYKDWEAVWRKLDGWSNKFCFQLEKGETGYLHWQCRINLVKKMLPTTAKARLWDSLGGHVSLTSSNVHQNPKSFNYVMKEDTRQEGPWTDELKLDPEVVITSQLKEFLTFVEEGKMYPWQKQMLEELQKRDFRTIHHICDPYGFSGKSIFCEYLAYLKIAHEMPMFKDMQDLIAFAFSFSVKPAYVVDMPRGLDKRKLADFYSGVECLKNGFIFDKRFCGRMKRFDRPQVCTFGNTFVDVRLLSQDRWKLWQMCEDKTLKPVSVAHVLDIIEQEEANRAKKRQKTGEADKPGSFQEKSLGARIPLALGQPDCCRENFALHTRCEQSGGYSSS